MSVCQRFSLFRPFVMAGSLLLLSACGGGGAGGTSAGGTASVSTYSGTAATGAAVPLGTVVTAKCASGSTGTVTMDGTGAFNLAVTDGAPPCVLKLVTPASAQTMYSVAMAVGVVNITPLTHAVIDMVAGGDVASAYTNWGGTFVPANLTAANLAAAQTALRTYLTKAGFSVSGVGDFLTESFPANSVNLHDKLLDEIKATNIQLSTLSAQAKSLVQLTDTGETTCFAETGAIIPCAGTGQSGELGLDASSATNSALDGVAGFSYLKLSSTGKPLAASAGSWDCVHDNITGLQWENKVVDTDTGHLRSSAHTYTWYSTDTANNGSNAGTTGANTTCNSTLGSSSPCNTKAYAAAVNAATLCGKSDWRLPTREELLSIVNYSALSPAIDVNYFPNTRSISWNSKYWSSQSYAGSTNSAWFIHFSFGNNYFGLKSNANFIRLVRSS